MPDTFYVCWVGCLKSSRTTIVTTHKSCISIESIVKLNYD
jgi:hypothetical protein